MNRAFRILSLVGISWAIAAWVAHADYYPYNSYRPSYSSSYPDYYSHSWGSSSAPRISLDLNPQDNLNSSFRIAAREDRLEDMKNFLREGAEINSRADSGETALMYAARNCSEPVVRFLLQEKANVNVRDQAGQTALILAAEGSCLPVVRLLLRVPGLKLAQKDKIGKTALDYATDQTTMDVGGPADEIVRLLGKTRKKERL